MHVYLFIPRRPKTPQKLHVQGVVLVYLSPLYVVIMKSVLGKSHFLALHNVYILYNL
jgi:hypothetical protein